MAINQTKFGTNNMRIHSEFCPLQSEVGIVEPQVAGKGTGPGDNMQKLTSHSTGTADGTVPTDTCGGKESKSETVKMKLVCCSTILSLCL